MKKSRRDGGQRRKTGAAHSKSETSKAKRQRPGRRQRKLDAGQTVKESFACFQCGASIPYSSERCPECKSYYIRGLRQQDVDELLKAEEMHGMSVDDFMEALSSPVLHFDAETGVMRFMDGVAGSRPNHECPRCGVLVEISTDSCPMCGHRMSRPDSGLMGVLQDSDFDPEPLDEADCPLCGEHVELESGRCPGCGTVFDSRDGPQAERKVLPVLRMDGVMFLRLDVESGEISFLRRNGAGCGYGHAVIDLEHAHAGLHGQAKSGASRG
jgi:rubrerythrin